jgi:hypothetical protein
MATSNNLDGSLPPPAMKKETRKNKKKEISTMVTSSAGRRRRTSAKRSLAGRRVQENLKECEKLLGKLINWWENGCHQDENNNNFGGPNAERSNDAASRRAYKDWSEAEITFDKGNCQDRSDLSSRNPIVIQPIISGHRVHDVLMDGGSALNIITVKKLDEMHISRSEIKPSSGSISASSTIGQIWLSVQLGSPGNFRMEVVLFDVVDNVDIPFNAILGRPAIAEFMAVLHHAYQCIKIPGPYGVITLASSWSGRHLS